MEKVMVPQEAADFVRKMADEVERKVINKMKKPKCKLVGEDGNVFNLIAIASKTLKRANLGEQAKEMQERVFKSGSYEKALNIIAEYVDIQ